MKCFPLMTARLSTAKSVRHWSSSRERQSLNVLALSLFVKVLVDEMIGSIVAFAPEDAAFTAKTLSNSSHDNPFSRIWHQLEICTKMVAGAHQAYSPLRLAAALSRNEAFDRYLSPG